MFTLTAQQKTISQFMGESTNIFLIPDYQRPYSWEEEECTKLWDDIFSFAFPDNDCNSFNPKGDAYFLGSLVVFRNANEQLEVIDGQQRLITLTLLLRAFYEAYGNDMTDEASHYAKWEISKCLWHIPSINGKPDISKLKITSEVVSKDEWDEFIRIMKDGKADKVSKEGKYSQNYRLFQKKIKEFQEKYPNYFKFMPERILANCCILPIETDGQNTALRIFSTMNDRGRPLSDSDIFKAKLYKAYSDHQQKDIFIQQWREFEETCGERCGVDDIFMRYMHYLRVSKGIKDTTVEGLRDFYSRNDNKFSPIVKDFIKTFEDLRLLADFWKDVAALDSTRFSERVRKSLFVLRYVPNNMWTFMVSVYFMTNKSDNGMLDDMKFYAFLQKITRFFLASRIIRPGNTTPFFAAMVDIAMKRDVSFSGYEFDEAELRRLMFRFDFNDSRKITRGMIAWYVFQNVNQTILPPDTRYDTEHILPRRRKDELTDEKNLEALGNKSLLEKEINIRASDYRFKDKAKYYRGDIEGKPKTRVRELQELADTKQDFTEQDIEHRTEKIIDHFISFIKEYGLTK